VRVQCSEYSTVSTVAVSAVQWYGTVKLQFLVVRYGGTVRGEYSTPGGVLETRKQGNGRPRGKEIT
jgi:hypothetical protein